MSRRSLVLTLAAGCSQPSAPARLADLLDPAVVASGTRNLLLYYSFDDTCFTTLAPDVGASVDGEPVPLEPVFRGECNFFGFSIPELATMPATTIELVDSETTWRFEVEGLAPGHWTIDAPAMLIEGGEFTVGFGPPTPGVRIETVLVLERPVVLVAETASTITFQIPAGFWSDTYPAWKGTTFPGTLDLSLGPLALRSGCPLRSCDFSTTARQTVPIVIP